MRRKNPELEKQQATLKKVLEALAILGYDLIGGQYYSQDEKQAGYSAKVRYKISKNGSVSSISFETRRINPPSTGYYWADSYRKELTDYSYGRLGMALKRLREVLPKVSAKTKELEIQLENRPGPEAIDYANSILQQVLGMEPGYQRYTVTLKSTVDVIAVVSIEANNVEAAIAKSMKDLPSARCWTACKSPEEATAELVLNEQSEKIYPTTEVPASLLNQEDEEEDEEEMEA